VLSFEQMVAGLNLLVTCCLLDSGTRLVTLKIYSSLKMKGEVWQL